MVPSWRSSQVSPAALAKGTSRASTCMMAVVKRDLGYRAALCQESLTTYHVHLSVWDNECRSVNHTSDECGKGDSILPNSSSDKTRCMVEEFLNIDIATRQFLRRRVGKAERRSGLTFVKRLRIGEAELAHTKRKRKSSTRRSGNYGNQNNDGQLLPW